MVESLRRASAQPWEIWDMLYLVSSTWKQLVVTHSSKTGLAWELFPTSAAPWCKFPFWVPKEAAALTCSSRDAAEMIHKGISGQYIHSLLCQLQGAPFIWRVTGCETGITPLAKREGNQEGETILLLPAVWSLAVMNEWWKHCSELRLKDHDPKLAESVHDLWVGSGAGTSAPTAICQQKYDCVSRSSCRKGLNKR